MEQLQKQTCERLYGPNGLIRAASLGRCTSCLTSGPLFGANLEFSSAGRSTFNHLGPLSLRDHLREERTPGATTSLLPEVGNAVRCVVIDVDPQRGVVCRLVGIITLNGSLAPVAEPAASWQAVVTSKFDWVVLEEQ
jgi:hypothetical protein